MLIDEVGVLNKKNGEYRGLVVENDHKLNLMSKELRDIQRTVALKDKLVERVE